MFIGRIGFQQNIQTNFFIKSTKIYIQITTNYKSEQNKRNEKCRYFYTFIKK